MYTCSFSWILDRNQKQTAVRRKQQIAIGYLKLSVK
jgi:hypothetical protein